MMMQGKGLRKLLAAAVCAATVLLAVSCAFGVTLAEIRERGVLCAALEDETWGLFHIWKDGSATGLDVDLAEKVAVAAGVSLKIMPLPWGDGEAGSLSGTWTSGTWPPFDVDIIISAATILPDRAKNVTFSEPYFTAGQMLLFRRDAPVSGPDALAGKKLGFQQATTSEVTAKERFASSTFVPFPAVPEALSTLRAGAVDALLLDSPLAMTEAKDDPSLAVLDELFSSEEFGIVMPLDVDPELRALVNDVVQRERDALYAKWFK